MVRHRAEREGSVSRGRIDRNELLFYYYYCIRANGYVRYVCIYDNNDNNNDGIVGRRSGNIHIHIYIRIIDRRRGN